nr:hypothetical protein Iba_chr15bCG1150 [Ipomoea batatas]
MSLGEAAAAEVVRKPTAQMMVLPRQWAEMSNCSSVQAATARNQGNHRQNWGNRWRGLVPHEIDVHKSTGSRKRIGAIKGDGIRIRVGMERRGGVGEVMQRGRRGIFVLGIGVEVKVGARALRVVVVVMNSGEERGRGKMMGFNSGGDRDRGRDGDGRSGGERDQQIEGSEYKRCETGRGSSAGGWLRRERSNAPDRGRPPASHRAWSWCNP